MFNVQTYRSQANVLTQRWANAVRAAGGGFETNSLYIANTFMTVLSRKSYYNKIKYLLPMLGRGINAALVPLIDVLNAGSATNINFVDLDFNQLTGLKGNNSNKVLLLPFFLSQLGNSQNGGVGFWSLDVSLTNNTQYSFGTSQVGAADPIYALRFGAPTSEPVCEFAWGTYTNRAILSEARSNSHYYGNRSSITSRILYKNGISVASNTSSDAAGDMSTLIPATYALNQVNTYAVYWGGSKGVEYYTDGTMTDSEALDFHNVLGTYLMIPSGKLFSPNDISGCKLWLKAGDITGSDGSTVSSWTDKSPAGNNLSATVGTVTYQTNIINGLPIVRFNGSSILAAAGSVLNSATTASIFIVFAPKASPLGMFFEQGSSDLSYESSGGINGLFYINNGGAGTVTGSTINVFEVKSMRANGSFITAYRNGIAGTPVSYSGGTSTNTFRLGGRSDTPALYTTSDIAEIIMYDNDIGDEAQNKIQQYLMLKYNIS